MAINLRDKIYIIVKFETINSNMLFNFYNAITPNNCFVKGSYKYDVYLVEENKAHLNLPIKDRIAILV